MTLLQEAIQMLSGIERGAHADTVRNAGEVLRSTQRSQVVINVALETAFMVL